MIYESSIPGLKLFHKGKVRDMYEIDDLHLLIVTTDRLSAFDVILPDPIPNKGMVLTKTSNYWFNKLQHIVPNHIADIDLATVIKDPKIFEQIKDQAIVVKKLKALPVEAIVRGYLIGSGWKDYKATGSVCGIDLPDGMLMAQKLEKPIYTPSTKADVGEHDENIDFEHTVKELGKDLAEQIKKVSLQLYTEAADYALEQGIIIADTKFEFGLDENNTLTLIDEALTPDSSRFWPAEQYEVNISPPSFDKQFVRDYLESIEWDKKAPGPKLPEDIINKTAQKYQEAMTQLFQMGD